MLNANLRRVLGLILLTAVGIAIAACTHRSPEQQAEWITSAISHELDLTADQRAKLEDIKQTVLDIRKFHQADRVKHLNELEEAILSEHLEAAKMKALVAGRQRYIEEGFDKVFKKLADFHAALSARQKKKAVEVIEKFASYYD